MIKSLSVSISDINKDDSLTITGTQQSDINDQTVILSVGQSRIPVDAKELAEALKEVVDFKNHLHLPVAPKSSEELRKTFMQFTDHNSITFQNDKDTGNILIGSNV